MINCSQIIATLVIGINFQLGTIYLNKFKQVSIYREFLLSSKNYSCQ